MPTLMLKYLPISINTHLVSFYIINMAVMNIKLVYMPLLIFVKINSKKYN